ncbi:hypothetical protein [Microcoleus vaginatus]|uniref:hypothetical protein n=1 Tax=Microcoleus vaginatus TaxID=119532 RepID=UPI0002F1BC01
MANTRTGPSASETASMVQRAKQYQVFGEQLLKWEKTASDCDRCSLMGEAVRYAIALLGE